MLVKSLTCPKWVLQDCWDRRRCTRGPRPWLSDTRRCRAIEASAGSPRSARSRRRWSSSSPTTTTPSSWAECELEKSENLFGWDDKMVWFWPCKNRESFVPVVVSCLNLITLYCEINWRHCLCKHFAIFWEFVKHKRDVNEG